MAPELQVLAINATCLAVAYLAILPAQVSRGLGRLALADLAIGVTALATSGALFWNSGAVFRLAGFETGWFGFALVTLVAMEVPLFLWFARRHGLGGGDGG